MDLYTFYSSKSACWGKLGTYLAPPRWVLAIDHIDRQSYDIWSRELRTFSSPAREQIRTLRRSTCLRREHIHAKPMRMRSAMQSSLSHTQSLVLLGLGFMWRERSPHCNACSFSTELGTHEMALGKTNWGWILMGKGPICSTVSRSQLAS